jgi:putative CRISPR-associated protein (TIGR02620 family)
MIGHYWDQGQELSEFEAGRVAALTDWAKMPPAETMVVTRHPGLVQYLVAEGLIDNDTQVVEHATPELVSGRHVIGVLPLWLAAEAASVTEIPMSIPPELRGTELTAEQTRRYAGPGRTYVVTAMHPPEA